MDVLGISIPDSRPIFLVVLAVHVPAGMVAVLAGARAAAVKKQPGRHPNAGHVYLGALATVALTAMLLALLRWPHDTHLAALGAGSFGAGVAGWQARRRQRPGWTSRHILGMGTSYVLLLTAFYVDNGPQLPGWRLLPVWALWVLPTVVGGPVIAWALWRRGVTPWRDGAHGPRSAGPRARRPRAARH